MPDIVILGSGNVANHFAKALKKAEINIKQIFGRNIETVSELAKSINSSYTTNIADIVQDADIYFFIMNDEANISICNQINIKPNCILAHTAGSQSINIFKNKTPNYGVFYPFQTFTKSVETDFSNVPICLEASNNKTYLEFEKIAQKLNCKTFNLDASKREIVHLSGVFAANFMNHCVNIAEVILTENNISTDIIKPLLEQSFFKLLNNKAANSQTGPAIRNDNFTIEKHIELIKENKQYSEVYQVLTNSIKSKFKIK
ncbi:MAG: DUF2520 domain-containing protein [Bacteroidales bacterium]|nr:DUF2520 domain-containing protein [Bacteroidales bacterium]MDD2387632.1 DUF2520 domain-containing protein [Bacteroidales bacterium]MDD4218233.1 DUF2520 domain-containing protein [Bacteroidales bacterium]